MVGALVLVVGGCVGGANPETLVDELRVVAVVAEPPEAAPGERLAVTAHIANTDLAESVGGAWTCVGFGGTCLEGDSSRMKTAAANATTSWSLVAPFESSALLTEEEEGAFSVWVMACEEGLCPLLSSAEPSQDELADPTALLETLPFEGVSLSRKSVWVSSRTPEERRKNPVLEPVFDEELSVEIGEVAELAFLVGEEATVAYGYASGGGFENTEYDIIDGQVLLTYVAGEDIGSFDLWVVVQGEELSSAVWTGSVAVN